MIQAVMDIIYMIFGPPAATLELIQNLLASIGDFFSNLF